MKRFLRRPATLVAAAALALTGLTVLSAPVQAAPAVAPAAAPTAAPMAAAAAAAIPDCVFPFPCGRVENNTGQSIQISWWLDDEKRWNYEWLANGQGRGGLYQDGVDVDRFYIPDGCVGGGTPGGGVQWYYPSGWDKLESNQTIVLRSIQCGDGYVYAWENPWNNDSGGNNRWCRWFNGDNNWQDDCGNFRNIASAVQNNSSGGNNLRFYIHPSNTGAYACLGSGDYWRDLSQGIYFSFSPGLSGYGQSANNNIASHRWVTYC